MRSHVRSLAGVLAFALALLALPADAQIRPPVLAALIRGCATWLNDEGQPVALSPRLAAAFVGLIEVESSGHAWAIDDDNGRRGYEPDGDFDSAVSQAATIIARNAQRYGESNVRVDLGLTQIDYMNFAKYHVTVPEIMHPCKNIEVGARMLSELFNDEDEALHQQGVQDPQRFWIALDRTLETYNSGSATGNPTYTRNIETAMRGPFVAQTLQALYYGVLPTGQAIAGLPVVKPRPTPQPDTLFTGGDAVPFANAHHAVAATPAPIATAIPAGVRHDDTEFAGNAGGDQTAPGGSGP